MSLFQELKRRNVIKVAAAYLIVAWLLMQVGDTLAPALLLPDWINSALAFFLILGFPVALIFAWAFEMTPEGLKKEKEIDRSQSITAATGQKLNYALIALLALAVIYIVIDKLMLEPPSDPADLQTVQRASPATDIAVDPSESRPSRKSIAVLPFANRSNLADDLFFTDGIHDDLLTQLAKIDDLKVISRTSVMEYRDTSKKIPLIASELGVATILEGGIQRAGNRIRINAQLIDVSTDEHLWAETFDREMTVENIFEIQTEITRQIVTAVRGELSSEEVATLQQLPTRSLEAYEAYMHAKAATFESTYSAEKYLRADEWANRAVSLDPAFSWAWTILVEVHGHAIWMGYDTSPARIEALKLALDNTLALDPDSAETLYALGEYHYRFEGDYRAALDAFSKAAEKQPGSARIRFLYATTLRRIGEFDKAVASYEKALQLDPINSQHIADYLLTLMFNAEYEKGILQAERAIRRFPQEDAFKSHLAFMQIRWKGDVARARALLDEMVPTGSFEYVTLASRVYLYQREFNRAQTMWNLPQIIRYSDYGGNLDSWRARQLGEIHMLSGDANLAAKVLNEFIATESATRRLTIRNQSFQLANLAIAYALVGEPQEALENMQQARSLIRTIGDGLAGAGIDGLAARVMALAGQRDQALQELARVVELPGSNLTRWDLTLDPRWDFFRDDERFNDLARPLIDP